MWRGRKLVLRRCDVSTRFLVVRDEGEGLPGVVFGFLKQFPIELAIYTVRARPLL